MSDWMESLEDRLAKPGRLSRRSLLGKLTKVAFAAGVAVAGSVIPLNAAYACRYVSCCCLDYPNDCSWCSSQLSCWTSCPGSCWEWVCLVGGSSRVDCIECHAQGCACASWQGPLAPNREPLAVEGTGPSDGAAVGQGGGTK